ncbi:MAG: GTP cyclohydrolase I FolE [Lysobacterales bacterium 69-70]|nr:GTP cyclohydrolase I [Xanthomonadaceae bacterium]ODU31487.1 MAG: GTP cyclohydrolase I FolE [Xanthomonadaceae bacterium SCN 69-320]ODV16985.1 MAG: GTP cyclohydrolase I FolE [Xanthomonadaceae bacterium SCN 69-25]OJY95700.1 MAG: GTP cyclohydrolase I FolE [Xanthomonadales bacterium 69-70]
MFDTTLPLPPVRPAAAPIAQHASPRPSRAEAEAAVRTLIGWAGDSPSREGLRDTPARVLRAYEEWFGGYALDPLQLLARDFDGAGYDDLVLLRDIPLRSVCEHHMAPIRGVAHVAYLPGTRVVGISKLARLVDAYARRLQIQERLTGEIADALQQALQPRGVVVVLRATHDCIASRGIGLHGVNLVTRRLLGEFSREPWRSDILAALAA